jgi:hypothetical protein
MQQINFGTISSLLLATLLLSSCSTFNQEPQIQIVTKIEKTVVPIVSSPKPVQMNDVKIYVVNKDNFEEFIEEYRKKNGGDARIVISVKDYENLSLNFAELRRYIEQQKEVIVYYEQAVTPLPEDNKSE